MKRITEYFLLEDYLTEKLTEKVNSLLQLGCELYGNPAVVPETEGNPTIYCQAMISYDESVNTEGDEDA